MSAAAPTTDATAPSMRADDGCLCCRSSELCAETTVISPFLAERALQSAPALTRIVFCQKCGLRFFDRGLSATEAARYYAAYRSSDYFSERHRHEPFYTRRAHDRIASWLRSQQRRVALAGALAGCGAPEHFESVLDYGGGDGGLIADLPADMRATFDLSGAAATEGTVQVAEADMAARQWSLAVCAQTLEHVSDPHATLATLAGLLSPQGWLYLEVPDEMWSNHTLAGNARDHWLRWLAGRRILLVATDTMSTACRILFGFLPPFGFIPMREHLQYFTESALAALVVRSGLVLVRCGRNSEGHIYAVATRKHPVAASPA